MRAKAPLGHTQEVAFEVRWLRVEDWAGFGQVRSRVYRGGGAVGADEDLLRQDSRGMVVVHPEAGVVGAATILDMTYSREGVHHRCAGVAAVGVLPEWRGKGTGTALMEDMIRLLREDGFALASLFPFRDRWYARFGFVTHGVRYEIKSPQPPRVATSELDVRQLEPGTFAEIAPVLEAWAQRYDGINRRTHDQWWRVLGGDTPLAVYAAGDPVEAYAVVRLVGDFWVPQEIKEFVWTTKRGYRALMGLFHGLTMNKSHLVWPEPADGPYLQEHYDRPTEVKLIGPAMYRLIEPLDHEAARQATRMWLGDPTRCGNIEQF